MTNILRDASVALRLFRKDPAFTAIGVLTLALGIAATTAIFSVIYATFFERLPYRDPDLLVMVWSEWRGNRAMVTAREFTEWKRQTAATFDDLNAWGGRTANVAMAGTPEQMQIAPATPGFLPMLVYGHPLALGRDFLEEEGTAGKNAVVIITHRIWRDRFGQSPNVIGQQIRINRQPFTIVGVLGAGPADENMGQLWVPLAFPPEELNNDARRLLVMGRLKKDVTLQQANAKAEAANRSVAGILRRSPEDWRVSVQPFRNNFLSDTTKRGLWLLLGAVGFVLLIACANVANLLLARGTAREREVAVRISIGASPRRIVSQLLIESVMFAVIGGVLGVALASGLLKVILALMPPFMLPTEANVRLNIPVLLCTLSVCGLSGILFGAAPAWQAARVDVHDALRDAARSAAGGGHGLRRALVIAEFALALTLLAGGGVAIQNLFALMNRDLGFRPERVLTFVVPIDDARFSTSDQIATFYRQLLVRIEALPGVRSASVSTGVPVRDFPGNVPVAIAGRPNEDPSRQPSALLRRVSTDYFDTFRIWITRGRTFTAQDQAGSMPVAIVNETFVKRFLQGADPLSQRVIVAPFVSGSAKPGPPRECQIVGVSADVASGGVAGEQLPEIDVPFWQSPWPRTTVAIRTESEPAGLQQSIAAILRSMDGDLPMATVKTMETIVSESLVRDRFNTTLFAGFAGVGLLLAAFGIYGVMSFVVAQRTREIGLRMALGANRAKILRQTIREGMTTALAGTIAGSVGAFYAVRGMRGLVAGLSGLDPLAFAIVAMTLLATALVACSVPAIRAASVDPMTALRQQ